MPHYLVRRNAALLGAQECRTSWCAGMPHFLVRSNAALLGAQNDVDTCVRDDRLAAHFPHLKSKGSVLNKYGGLYLGDHK